MSQSDNTPLLSSRQGVSLLLPFLAVTTCFAMWGFANDITAPLVKAFSKIFRMSVTEGALVQVAFYLGYDYAGQRHGAILHHQLQGTR